jgi:hypothetical protein
LKITMRLNGWSGPSVGLVGLYFARLGLGSLQVSSLRWHRAE